jgi:hypothetical protein
VTREKRIYKISTNEEVNVRIGCKRKKELNITYWEYGNAVRFPAEAGIFLFATASRPALGSTEPPIQWELGALFPEVKRPRQDADHSPPPASSAEGKNMWSYTSTSPPRGYDGVHMSLVG